MRIDVVLTLVGVVRPSVGGLFQGLLWAWEWLLEGGELRWNGVCFGWVVAAFLSIKYCSSVHPFQTPLVLVFDTIL